MGAEMAGGGWRSTAWSWASRDSDDRSGLQHIDGRVSVAELIEHIYEVAPGVDLSDITVDGSIRWTRPATPDELAARERQQRESEARHREWEARHIRMLIDKYGDDLTQWPSHA